MTTQTLGPALLEADSSAERLALPKFPAEGDFNRDLRARIDRYFDETKLDRRDSSRMYLKTFVCVAWCVASYGLLLAFGASWWLGVPLAISLALSICAVAFNVQHDGNHQAYSRRSWVNRLMAMSLDALGGSSYLWGRKHNTVHHSYTNVAGHDDDIEVGALARLSPHHKRYWFHRIQHLYMWVLYGVLTIKWQLFDDFHDVIRKQSGGKPYPRPRGWDLVVFLGGKTLFAILAFVIPLQLLPWQNVLGLFLVASLVEGVVLSVVFQLAHCVEEADFPLPDEASGRMESAWMVHQIETTVNFSRRSRLVSWFVGGLNFQVEHHLFPRICHVHYPALAPIVEETCRDHGIVYRDHGSLFSGIASHYRLLRRLGASV